MSDKLTGSPCSGFVDGKCIHGHPVHPDAPHWVCKGHVFLNYQSEDGRTAYTLRQELMTPPCVSDE